MDAPAPRRRFPAWLIIVATLVALLILVVVAGFVWLRSDADLRAFDAMVRSAGGQATWADRHLVVDAWPTVADIRALDTDSAPLLAPATQTWKPEPGGPPPDDVRQRHRDADGTLVARVQAFMARLGGTAPVLYAEGDISTLIPWPLTWRTIARWQAERVVLAPPDQVEAEVERLLTWIDAHPRPRVMIGHLVQVTMLLQACPAIAARIEDLRGNTLVIAHLRRQAADLLHEYAESEQEELLVGRQTVSDAHRAVSSAGFSSGGIGPIGFSFLLRLGRRAYLDQQRGWVVICATSSDPRALLMAAVARESASLASRKPWRLDQWAASIFMSTTATIVARTIDARLMLETLAAALAGDPWPEDPFAPPGTPLLRLERDGHLVGPYSVGKNGTDDGGDTRKDLVIPLYLPAKAPMPLPEGLPSGPFPPGGPPPPGAPPMTPPSDI